MRDAARVLDDVSDHLGEVLRRSDELLAEWSRFGAEVRTQVGREVAAIGEVIDDAVARTASTGLDRAIADRLRALTGELERLEQRTRAAARAAAEQREGDRRVLWIAVAGIVLANALLVALLLRRPEPAPVAEPIRIESAAPQPPPGPSPGTAPVGSVDATSTANAGSAAAATDQAAPGAGAGSNAPGAGSNAPGAGSNAPGAAGTKPGAGSSAGPNVANAANAANAAKPGGGVASGTATKPVSPDGAAKQPEAAGSARPAAPATVLPPRGSPPRPHKKLP